MFSISMTTTVKGNVVTTERALIDGIFCGSMEAGERITVTGRAVVAGVLVADEIVIDGQVSADIYARRLVLGDTATVRGRLFHADLVIGRLTYFEGQSRRHENPRTHWHTTGAAP